MSRSERGGGKFGFGIFFEHVDVLEWFGPFTDMVLGGDRRYG